MQHLIYYSVVLTVFLEGCMILKYRRRTILYKISLINDYKITSIAFTDYRCTTLSTTKCFFIEILFISSQTFIKSINFRQSVAAPSLNSQNHYNRWQIIYKQNFYCTNKRQIYLTISKRYTTKNEKLNIKVLNE